MGLNVTEMDRLSLERRFQETARVAALGLGDGLRGALGHDATARRPEVDEPVVPGIGIPGIRSGILR